MTAPIDTFVAPPCLEQVEILFQDKHLLLVNKPSGLLSLSILGALPVSAESVQTKAGQAASAIY
ncbi:hypothetical protein [Aestuariirhabdus sp. LZHN29]|uniref:hypothetical protein n=1 Tax=Aestuariirhabdus sp. LZHN29 TaxID=3417462 RepID=UPI003CF25B5D